MTFDSDYVSVSGTDYPLFVSADVAIRRVVERCKIKIQLSGGSSTRGWSAWRILEQCPYLYYLKYVAREPLVVESASSARDIGSLVHAFLAIHYRCFKRFTVEDFIQAIMDESVNPMALITARSVFDAYRVHYSPDIFVPLAVEVPAMDPLTQNTCRYDAVVRVDDPPEGISKGIWICEHKTASRFTADVLDGWVLDGEILGELAFWKPAGMDKKFGKLQGVIINVLGKQKVPQFYRTYVAPVAVHTEMHTKNLAWLDAFLGRCHKTKTWPQYFASCMGRYGKCDAFDHCLNRGLE